MQKSPYYSWLNSAMEFVSLYITQYQTKGTDALQSGSKG